MLLKLFWNFYSFSWIVVTPLLWIYSLWIAFRIQGNILALHFSQRLGRGNIPPEFKNGILIHSASMGEISAATPLIRELRRSNIGKSLVLTCTSMTGIRKLKKEFSDIAHVRFIPIDAGQYVNRFLDAVQPRAIVLMETEIWPNIIRGAKARRIPVILANARMSERSCRRYARFRIIFEDIISGIDLILAQDRYCRRRFEYLRSSPEGIYITGNLKADITPNSEFLPIIENLKILLRGRFIMIAASTHDDEEKIMLEAWKKILEVNDSALMILAPRHPQRFEAVAALVVSTGMAMVRRSRNESPDHSHPVWLADTLGEMEIWFSLADIAFIGGSLVPHGGHNPIEAMMQGCPIVSGRHVQNFASIFSALNRAGAVTWLEKSDPCVVTKALSALMLDASGRQQQGYRSFNIYQKLSGGTLKSCRLIGNLLAPTIHVP